MEARNTVTNVWYTSSKCPETHGSDRDGLNRAEVLAGNPIKQQGTYGQEETDSIKKKKSSWCHRRGHSYENCRRRLGQCLACGSSEQMYFKS